MSAAGKEARSFAAAAATLPIGIVNVPQSLAMMKSGLFSKLL